MANVSELVFRVLADTKGIASGLAPATKGLKDVETSAKQADAALDKLDADKVTIDVNAQAVATARARIDALKAEMREGIRVGADTTAAQREIATLTRQIRTLDDKPARIKVDTVGTNKAAADLADIRNEMTGLVGLTPGLMKLGPLIASIGAAAVSLRSGAANEQLAASFDMVTKSATDTKLIMDEIDRLGTTRPFDMDDLEAAGLALARFHVEAEAIPSLLEDIGTISLVSGKSVEELTRTVAALTVTGAQQARGLRTLEKEGVKAYDALAAATGLTTDETVKLAKEGKFSQQQILGMVRVLAEWNEGAADRATETLTGQLTMLRNRSGEVAEGLGMKLLPAAKTVLGVLSGLAGVIEKIPSGVIAIGTGIGIFIGASKLMGLAVEGIRVKVASLTVEMRAAATAATGLGVATRGIIGALGGPWGLAITAAITLLGVFASAQDKATKETEELAKEVDLQRGAFDSRNRQAVAQMLVDKDLAAHAKNLGLSLSDITTALLSGDDAYLGFYDRLRQLTYGQDQNLESGEKLAAGIEGIRGSLKNAATDQADFNSAVGSAAFDTAAEDADDYAKKLDEVKAAAVDAASAVDAMFDVLFGAQKGAFELETDVDEFFRGFNDAVKENREASEGARLANRKLISEGVELAKRAREQALSEGKSVVEANDAYLKKITRLEDAADKQGILTEEVDAYLETLKRIPVAVTSEVKAQLDADSTGFVAVELAKLGYDVTPFVKPEWLANEEVKNSLAALGVDITPWVMPKVPPKGSAAEKELRGALDELATSDTGEDRTVTYVPEVKPGASAAVDKELDAVKYETGTTPRVAQIMAQVEKLSVQIAMTTLDNLTKPRTVTITPQVKGTVTLPGGTTGGNAPTPGGTRVGSTRVYLDSAPLRNALRGDVESAATQAALTATTARRL